jgi:predicted XRE-type DNA-binding protein
MADSVFYDLADTPEEAANLTARGMLMIAIEQRIREEGWTQTEAAARLHLTQPRVSDLLNGKINKFSLDALVNMLPPVGLAIDVRHIERSPSRRRRNAEASPQTVQPRLRRRSENHSARTDMHSAPACRRARR